MFGAGRSCWGQPRMVHVVLAELQTSENHLRTVSEVFSKGSVPWRIGENHYIPSDHVVLESHLVPFKLGWIWGWISSFCSTSWSCAGRISPGMKKHQCTTGSPSCVTTAAPRPAALPLVWVSVCLTLLCGAKVTVATHTSHQGAGDGL